jgi:hypothetical protein
MWLAPKKLPSTAFDDEQTHHDGNGTPILTPARAGAGSPIIH